ncbi:Uncharacterised protein [Rhodococcus gordoniae]|uniref:Uncharacterized protein n=1 Tax=Rhodococcus gordoniae TaxID=223392 RepID=A0A379M121_9NOCA|nr:Uncharacterised protein [Rhodococcus gordoniae]
MLLKIVTFMGGECYCSSSVVHSIVMAAYGCPVFSILEESISYPKVISSELESI